MLRRSVVRFALPALLICLVPLASAFAGPSMSAACTCKSQHHATAAYHPYFESIAGTAPSLTDDSQQTYTVLCLPKDYRHCFNCMATKNAFDSDRDLLDVRRQTKYWVYVDGDPDFDYRWKQLLPEVGAGKTVVVAMRGKDLLYKETSPDYRGLGERIKKKLQEKLCPLFCPDCNKHHDEVDNNQDQPIQQPDRPIENVIKDTAEVASDEGGLALAALVVSLAAWPVVGIALLAYFVVRRVHRPRTR